MSIAAGEIGKQAVEQFSKTGGDATSRGGFDMPGERASFDSRDIARSDTGRPGAGFDGPWDRQDSIAEVSGEKFQFNDSQDNKFKGLDASINDYNNEVRNKSAGGDFQDVQQEGLTKSTPEEIAKARLEFQKTRNDLIKNWEDVNNRTWPTYDQDVATSEGKTIRKKGDRYDAHHVKPLELGGNNTVENITPMHAKDHFDKQGIHQHGSAYDRMVKAAKEV